MFELKGKVGELFSNLSSVFAALTVLKMTIGLLAQSLDHSVSVPQSGFKPKPNQAQRVMHHVLRATRLSWASRIYYYIVHFSLWTPDQL